MTSEQGTILFHARGQMTPDECDFHARLGDSLARLGLALHLVTHHAPQAKLHLPITVMPNGLEYAGKRARKEVIIERKRVNLQAQLPLNWQQLLQRERHWWGHGSSPEQQDLRRLGLAWFMHEHSELLRRVDPALTIIWNGHHPQEMILAGLCGQSDCPVEFLERGPLPGTIQLDPDGVLAGTRIARAQSWPEPSARFVEAYERIAESYRKSGQTWWEQPAMIGHAVLRDQLKIPTDALVVLFAGQVDADIQNLLYTPNYETNLDAFGAVLDRLAGHGRVYLLGKHHPKSSVPAERYRAVLEQSGVHGVWTETASLGDALALADRVCAANSTVLYEALVLEKPVLSLGESLLSNKGIAYTLDEADAWLDADEDVCRGGRWKSFAGALLENHLFSMRRTDATHGLRETDELALYLAAAMRKGVCKRSA